MNLKPYRLYLVVLLALASLLTASWLSHQRLHRQLEDTMGETLNTVLAAAHQGVSRWAERERTLLENWSDNPELRRATQQLLDSRREQASLLASPAQGGLREQLRAIMMIKGYRGYRVLDREGLILAANNEALIGSRSLLADEEAFLARLWSGYSAISDPLLPTETPADTPGAAQLERSMFVGAPIFNERQEVIALCLLLIDPHRDFTSILQQGRMGRSGESYAFNRRGEMISVSRFASQLPQLGVVEHETQRIALRDPGVDLTVGETTGLARAAQPLTLMAQQALEGRDGANLTGYRDYRGVMVAGAWRWDERLQMGFATEIDLDEANESERFATIVIILFSTISALLIVTALYIFDRGRRNVARQSQELSRIIDGMPVAMMVSDNAGNIDHFNRHFITQYGWQSDDIRNVEQWWQVAFPDEVARRQARATWDTAQHLAGDELHEMAPQQWVIRCKDGTEREVEARRVVVSAKSNVIALIDLSELNRAMRALRAEAQWSEQLLDTVEVVILTLDANGTITGINPAGCKLLGYTEEELLGRNWFASCLPEELRTRLMEGVHLPAMAESGAERSYVENEVVTRSGERRLIAWYNSRLRDEKGTIIGTLSAGSDITATRRREAEQTQMLLQLQRLQKAEAIGQLSAGVSHNFNNMFASTIGFLGLARRKIEAGGDADLKRYLDEALNSSYRARDLVAQIASFSRKQAVHKGLHDLPELVEQSLKLAGDVLPQSIALRSTIDAALAPLLVDGEQFQQALFNLLSNASDAMAGEGVIELHGYSSTCSDRECSSCHQHFSGDYVALEVRDTGKGMDAQTLQRCFEPFFTTKEVGQGTGMGLPVVHGILHSHGGHLQIASAPGTGTAVILYLPAATQASG